MPLRAWSATPAWALAANTSYNHSNTTNFHSTCACGERKNQHDSTSQLCWNWKQRRMPCKYWKNWSTLEKSTSSDTTRAKRKCWSISISSRNLYKNDQTYPHRPPQILYAIKWTLWVMILSCYLRFLLIINTYMTELDLTGYTQIN